MVDVRQTTEFRDWLSALRDDKAVDRINARIRRLSLGNPGDVKSVSEGVSEMRVDHGSGYRIYFVQRGTMLAILLCGGDKRTKIGTSRGPRSWSRRFRMAIETVPWTIQDHIATTERQIGYLEAAFEDGDPTLIAAAIGDIARARGMTKVAEEAGVTREALYKALSPKGDPRLSTLVGVMRALGIKLVPTATSPLHI